MTPIEKIGLTAEEAAEALRVSERTILDLIKSGNIKAVKIGNRAGWRIHPDAIAEWMKAGTPELKAEDDE